MQTHGCAGGNKQVGTVMLVTKFLTYFITLFGKITISSYPLPVKMVNMVESNVNAIKKLWISIFSNAETENGLT